MSSSDVSTKSIVRVTQKDCSQLFQHVQTSPRFIQLSPEVRNDTLSNYVQAIFTLFRSIPQPEFIDIQFNEAQCMKYVFPSQNLFCAATIISPIPLISDEVVTAQIDSEFELCYAQNMHVLEPAMSKKYNILMYRGPDQIIHVRIFKRLFLTYDWLAKQNQLHLQCETKSVNIYIITQSIFDECDVNRPNMMYGKDWRLGMSYTPNVICVKLEDIEANRDRALEFVNAEFDGITEDDKHGLSIHEFSS